MSKNIITYILIICIGILCQQCANRLGLEGGERDQSPPTVSWDDSDMNFQKNFEKDNFTLSFDEFVKVDKPSEQIVVSPPLKYNLTPVSRGKKIIFNFHPEEVLRENTTYTIQFGEAIQDITESNPINNLRYVFSTGNVIDSMQVRVQLRHLLDHSVVSGALVMLYETMSDTMIRSGRPIYFSKSDSSGLAIVQNCRPGQYRVFALTDENRNYQLDLPEEEVGHIDTFITSTLDETIVHQMHLYKEIEPPYRLNAVRADSQLIALTIGGEKNYLKWRTDETEEVLSYWKKDTLFLYLLNPVERIILESDYAKPDTVLVDKLIKNKSKSNRFAKLKNGATEAKLLDGNMQVRMRWNNPITEIDAAKVYLFDYEGEPVGVPDLIVDRDTQSLDNVTFTWKHKERRDSILFLPGAISSWFSQNDTILIPLRPSESESLSNLLVEVTGLLAANQYVLQLKSDKAEVLDKIVINGEQSFDWKVKGLFPSKHVLTLITDLNSNGSVDGGWFDSRQLPEPTISREIDNLRPDWDVQTSIQPQ